MGHHKQNMFKTIARECNLKTLTKAIVSEGLVETISTRDPITVFGPTDKAFKNFTGCGDLTLTQILQYHVVPEFLPLKKFKDGKKYQTLLGKMVRVNVYKCPTFNEVTTVNGVQMSNKNICATNGVLHKIKKVLCPPSGTIADIVKGNPDFSYLKDALIQANLVDALDDPESDLTVFAPTNQAFEKLLVELGITLEQLLDLHNLAEILLYHVLGQTVFSVAIKDGKTRNIPTLDNEKTIDLIRKCDKDKIYVKDQQSRMAKVIGADILAENGVIHVIDKVLLP